jgi:hypothetical protein
MSLVWISRLFNEKKRKKKTLRISNQLKRVKNFYIDTKALKNVNLQIAYKFSQTRQKGGFIPLEQ